MRGLEERDDLLTNKVKDPEHGNDHTDPAKADGPAHEAVKPKRFA